MGWKPEQAIGKTVTLWQNEGKVIGVVKDFHFRPLTATIEPFLFHYWPRESYSRLFVKTNPNKVREAISDIEQFYRKYEKQTAPEYEFVNQALESQYRTEQRTSRIVLYFSLLAIFVSCLGLFGLTTFSAEQRTKEIGIRKVLGASVNNIVTLFSQDFIKLVMIAIVIGCPIAWYSMTKWLQDFAYRIDIQWWIFLLAGCITVAIALLTVSFQAIKTALTDPVKSLRSE
jgi:ABC-type antimicrobial peptide transport system permease subunit